MITAEQLTTLTTMKAADLTAMVNKNLKTKLNFVSCRFLGLTNGKQFCYSVVALNADKTESSTKVFITCESDGKVSAST
jgi:hypothetical protein